MVVGRQRRLDTKKFTVTIDLTSNKNTVGIVRMFLGPKINNKQQLNDNRKNFVELDQFIVKLNNGKNVIRRHSVDFKNVVGNPESLNVLYTRTINFLRKGGKGGTNTLDNINYDTNNNNRGFPHRLLLPKGTTGGQDFTLFVTINDLDRTNRNDVKYMNNNNWNNFVKDTNKDNTNNNNGRNNNGYNNNDNNNNDNNNNDNNDSGNTSSDSNSSSGSNSRGRFNSGSNSNSRGRFNSGSNSNSRGRTMRFNRNGRINFNRRYNSGNRSNNRSFNRYVFVYDFLD
jgi:Hemocyanin, ig-like domain